eukprot:TRINITY_DN1540_c0_g1_i3.p1 TRINITY_DN1540_c0_g1~~TRINITY_DN1540_c0_g1_i3.p1  ORF type:complete len:1293 (+),score=297.17 TRINITY_DN1540_c0_g1_i3:448-3879(+)
MTTQAVAATAQATRVARAATAQAVTAQATAMPPERKVSSTVLPLQRKLSLPPLPKTSFALDSCIVLPHEQSPRNKSPRSFTTVLPQQGTRAQVIGVRRQQALTPPPTPYDDTDEASDSESGSNLHTENNLVFRERADGARVLVAATPQALAAFVTSPQTVHDDVIAYLLTFPLHTKPDALVTYLVERFQNAEGAQSSKIRERVVAFMQLWAQHMFRRGEDLLSRESDAQVAQRMRRFLQDNERYVSKAQAHEVLAMLDRTPSASVVADSSALTTPLPSASVAAAQEGDVVTLLKCGLTNGGVGQQKRRSAIATSTATADSAISVNAPILPLRSAALHAPLRSEAQRPSLDILHPKEIARQLTIIDEELFQAIRPCDWLTVIKGPVAPTIIASTDFYNKISGWVLCEVCTCEDLRMRIHKVEKFIEIATYQQRHFNLSGVIQILSALNNTAVFRLSRTWDGVSPWHREQRDSLTKLQSLPQCQWEETENILTSQSAGLPFVGTFKTMLIRAAEGNETLVDGKVNFAKCRILHSLVNKALCCQRKAHALVPLPGVSEWLRGVPSITVETADEWSRQIEPDALHVEPSETNAVLPVFLLGSRRISSVTVPRDYTIEQVTKRLLHLWSASLLSRDPQLIHIRSRIAAVAAVQPSQCALFLLDGTRVTHLLPTQQLCDLLEAPLPEGAVFALIPEPEVLTACLFASGSRPPLAKDVIASRRFPLAALLPLLERLYPQLRNTECLFLGVEQGQSGKQVRRLNAVVPLEELHLRQNGTLMLYPLHYLVDGLKAERQTRKLFNQPSAHSAMFRVFLSKEGVLRLVTLLDGVLFIMEGNRAVASLSLECRHALPLDLYDVSLTLNREKHGAINILLTPVTAPAEADVTPILLHCKQESMIRSWYELLKSESQVNREHKMFGEPLSHTSSGEIPEGIFDLLNFLYNTGALRHLFDFESRPHLNTNPSDFSNHISTCRLAMESGTMRWTNADAYCAGRLLLSYLAALPEPVITRQAIPRFLELGGNVSPTADDIGALRQLLLQLPPAHVQLAACLLAVLERWSALANVPTDEVAMTFAAAFVGPSAAAIPAAAAAVRRLLSRRAAVFGVDALRGRTSVELPAPQCGLFGGQSGLRAVLDAERQALEQRRNSVTL